jgi:hypothetical protein
MSLYISTRGLSTAAVGVCDRCKMKRPLSFFVSDGDAPGLRVCPDGCSDALDPYKLPARRAERIILQYPRPDEDLSVFVDSATGLLVDSEGNFLIDSDGNFLSAP